MRRIVQIFIEARLALIGTAGTVLLDQISKVVSIAVGLVTLVYLAIRIWREVRSRNFEGS